MTTTLVINNSGISEDNNPSFLHSDFNVLSLSYILQKFELNMVMAKEITILRKNPIS
jgi:hypothetical protein